MKLQEFVMVHILCFRLNKCLKLILQRESIDSHAVATLEVFVPYLVLSMAKLMTLVQCIVNLFEQPLFHSNFVKGITL